MRFDTFCRRRRLALAAGALAAAWAARAAAEPATYVIDPDRSQVHFELLHFKTSTLRGRFGAPQGSVVLDRDAHSAAAQVRVATAGVSTGLPAFDERIRRADLLAADAHPEAYFVATRSRWEGDTPVELRGEFTLRGVSQPLSLRATRFGCRSDDAGEVCGGDFEGEILRSAFGADFGLPLVGDSVRLLVRVEGRRR